MKKFALTFFFACLFLPGSAFAAASYAIAQAVTCPASGTNIQIFAANFGRQSMAIINTSGATIRIAELPASDGTIGLTDSNSIEISAGMVFADSAPSNYVGSVECSSTNATPETVYVIETLQS